MTTTQPTKVPLIENASVIVFEETSTTVTDYSGLAVIQLKRRLCGLPQLVPVEPTITKIK